MGLFKKTMNQFGVCIFSINELEEMRDDLFEKQEQAKEIIEEQQKENKNMDPYTLTKPIHIGGEICMLSELINLSTPIKRIGLQTIDPDNPPNIKLIHVSRSKKTLL